MIQRTKEERLIMEWKRMTRTEKIDEVMCMECTDTYTERRPGEGSILRWIMTKLAELLTDFEKTLGEQEAEVHTQEREEP